MWGTWCCLVGAPNLDARALIDKMTALAPGWLAGGRLCPYWFEPTFHKHIGTPCAGLQIHVDDPRYEHAQFRPWRVLALTFKALRALQPDYDRWRDFSNEYEQGRLAIDVINGGPLLRQWVDDPPLPWRPRRPRRSRRSHVSGRTHPGVTVLTPSAEPGGGEHGDVATKGPTPNVRYDIVM